MKIVQPGQKYCSSHDDEPRRQQRQLHDGEHGRVGDQPAPPAQPQDRGRAVVEDHAAFLVAPVDEIRGSSARTRVPRRRRDDVERAVERGDPVRQSAQPASPRGSAPPRPSSDTSITSRSSWRWIATSALDASAYLATFVSASAATRYCGRRLDGTGGGAVLRPIGDVDRDRARIGARTPSADRGAEPAVGGAPAGGSGARGRAARRSPRRASSRGRRHQSAATSGMAGASCARPTIRRLSATATSRCLRTVVQVPALDAARSSAACTSGAPRRACARPLVGHAGGQLALARRWSAAPWPVPRARPRTRSPAGR